MGMTRQVLVVLVVVFAVLAPALALASMHCLLADCDGPCVPAVTLLTVIVTASVVTAAKVPEAKSLLSSLPLRLPDLPPRQLPSAA